MPSRIIKKLSSSSTVEGEDIEVQREGDEEKRCIRQEPFFKGKVRFLGRRLRGKSLRGRDSGGGRELGEEKGGNRGGGISNSGGGTAEGESFKVTEVEPDDRS